MHDQQIKFIKGMNKFKFIESGEYIFLKVIVMHAVHHKIKINVS